jgi:HlyD family secretion protein
MPGPARRPWTRPLIAVVVVALLAFGLWQVLGGNGEPAARYRTAAVDRGDLRVAISATGALRALSTLRICPETCAPCPRWTLARRSPGRS